MKKYMLPLLAFTLIAGISNAQTTDKKPLKTSTNKSAAAVKKTTAQPAASSTATVSPQTKSTASTAGQTIKRKHHRKSKPVKKTESK